MPIAPVHGPASILNRKEKPLYSRMSERATLCMQNPAAHGKCTAGACVYLRPDSFSGVMLF